MAVIARRTFLQGGLLSALVISVSAQDRETELRSQIGQITTSLSANNPADALAVFSKSYPHYDELRRFFIGLADAYEIVNEAEVMNEEDSQAESKLTVNWSLTLNSQSGEPGPHRSATLQLRFVREKNKWKIGDLSPVSFFDPSSQ